MESRAALPLPAEDRTSLRGVHPRPADRREARRARTWSGGIAGNEALTRATAAILTVLLVVEGLTILQMGSLLSVHMFIGLVLIPPILLKLGSTGYRFFRYYTRSATYREKGPPMLLLRLLAPVLVASTIGVFASGVALLLIGHQSNMVLLLHKASFVVWGAVFGIHFLAYAPRVLRSLRHDWTNAKRESVGGGGLRAMLLASALGGGVALAVAALPTISNWQLGG